MDRAGDGSPLPPCAFHFKGDGGTAVAPPPALLQESHPTKINLANLVSKCGLQRTLKTAKFAGKYFRSCSNIPQQEEKEQKWGRGAEGWRGSLLEPVPEGRHQHLPSSTMKSPVVWTPRLSEKASTECPFLSSSQLGALTPSLLGGRELPDAAVLQQWLNVLVTAPLGGVRQAAADAVAVFLGSTAFAVFRDE